MLYITKNQKYKITDDVKIKVIPLISSIELEEVKKDSEVEVVEILNVSKVDGADKLLKFIIDTGTEKRQIVSGIAKYYTNIEELVGRKVLAITNLEPVTLRNELSQGMLLTTEEKKRTQLIEVSHDVKLGSLVK